MPNYFAPAFQVEVNGQTLAADISKNIQQVSVGLKKDLMDTFNLVIANAYPMLRWTHTSDADLFKEGTSVRIALGYVDDLREVISGEITKIGLTFPDSGMPTVTIDGYTLLHRLSAAKKTRSFQKMSDKQVVQQIGGEAALEVQADETGSPLDYLMQSNQTDLEFVSARAKRIRFEVLARDNKLLFRKPPEESPNVYTLVWGHAQAAFAGGSSNLPLKNFTPELNAMNQGPVTVRGYDPAGKKPIVGRANQGDEDAKMNRTTVGTQITTRAFNRSKEYIRVNVPVVSQAEADQHAKAIYNERSMGLVTGSGSTIGIPALKPGAVVELAGLGPRFSGLYYVSEATHAMGSAGYSTNFSVQRNDA